MCPFPHFQDFLLWLPAISVVGSHPLACLAISKCVVKRSLKPVKTFLFLQYGHGTSCSDFAETTLLTVACHLCWSKHTQPSLLLLLLEICSGSQPSTYLSSSGCDDAKSFCPGVTLCPEQNGQPEPATRLRIGIDHLWPWEHFQSKRIFIPLE